MLTWVEFAAAEPELASAGVALLYPPHIGVGLAYLSTVRPDGGPRVHPMCPIITAEGLFALIVPGPKCGDLLRDGRYAMHSFPTDDNEDAFYVTGVAEHVDDVARGRTVVGQFLTERSQFEFTEEHLAEQMPFAFRVDTAMLTRTTGHGDPEPRHTIWKA